MTDEQYMEAQALNTKAAALVEMLRGVEPWQYSVRIAILDEFSACMKRLHDILNDDI